jgi:hypothetical protein
MNCEPYLHVTGATFQLIPPVQTPSFVPNRMMPILGRGHPKRSHQESSQQTTPTRGRAHENLILSLFIGMGTT